MPHLLHALLRQDLASFIARAFATVAPNSPFQPNWHIDVLADYLAACTRGDITRLVINLPPRALKSVSVTVAWPAWLLGRRPTERIIAASYSQQLALKHALDCRLLMETPWYQSAFPHTRLQRGENEKHRFVTTRRGYRLATSVGGTLTGEGGNLIIVDDPLNPRQAMSHDVREGVNDWYRQTLMSRLDDPRRGAVVIVMQRLHRDDLSGFALEQPGWEHLCLPAQADRPLFFDYGRARKHMPSGELLHPARLSPRELDRIREALGAYAFAAQYLQSPVPPEGTMIQPHWLLRYQTPPQGRTIHSWDTAIKTGAANDYSVGTVWVCAEGNYYLMHLVRRRMDYPDLRRAVLELAAAMPPDAILIEDKASGQGLIQELRRDTALPVIPIQPEGDKVVRAARASALMESGRVFFPAEAPWLAVLERELFSFPATTHDDQVDSLSQFLLWAHRHASTRAGLRRV